MKLADPRFWIGVLSVTGVTFLSLESISRKSPGPLSASHGQERGLRSRFGCSECHGDSQTSVQQACLECHEPIALHLEESRGLHGNLPEAVSRSCGLCHSEHHGKDFRLVNRRSFVIAGHPSIEEFDHASIGWQMEGAHLDLDCTECHANADADMLEVGQHRFLGLTQDCASCHESPHQGRLTSCTDCHGQTAFDQLQNFTHTEEFPLVGGHGDASCLACHERGDAHAVEVLADPRRKRKPESRDCAVCHESPHSSLFVRRIAMQVQTAPGATCNTCHEPEVHLAFRPEDGPGITRRQHNATGFPLVRPHADLACVDCHQPLEASFQERHPGREAQDCAACHEDPHGGQFEVEPFLADGCLSCHSPHEWAPHGFDDERHAETRLPLVGRHAELECSACHEDPVQGESRRFHGTPARCESCHTDAHEGFFSRFNRLLRAEPAGTCAVCHTPHGFDEVPYEAFDHDRWTGFELNGAHAQNECESCHVPSRTADEHGRTFGRLAQLIGTVEGCSSCHQDPHAGHFDRKGLPQEVDGRLGCARCHGEISFRAFPHGFDHGDWTGFTLDGAHGELDCTKCHTPLHRPTVEGRTWNRAAGTSCSDCHLDPHVGQFDEDGRTDCTRCHTTEKSFEHLGDFDHDTDTAFELDETHAALDCSACHQPWIHKGRSVVRYKPLGQDCTDCHGVNRSRLRRRGKKP